MMIVIPTWIVRVSSEFGGEDETFRVPETSLNAFLGVLTFNKRAFSVDAERETQEASA